MADELFDFDTQLAVGDKGELDFKKYYRSLGPKKSKERKYDFDLADGTTVELKTDTYDMANTPNFFMEIFGSVTEGKIGGPWRAMQDGITHFVYYFSKNRTFFWFRSDDLCRRLDMLVASGRFEPKEIRNKGWAARGYAIPRQEIVDVLVRKDTF